MTTGTLLRELTPPLANSGWGRLAAIMAPSPDGKILATATGNHTIRFIDLATGNDLPAPAGHASGVDFLSYTADSKSLFTSSADGTLELWDAATGKHVKRVASPDRQRQTATAGGRYSAIEDLSGISIQSADGNELAKIPARGGSIMSVGGRLEELLDKSKLFFSPDGLTLVVGRWGAAPELYHVPSGKERCRVTLPSRRESEPGGLQAPATLFFAPDGQRFAVYSYAETRSLTVHETATGKSLPKILPGQYPGLRGGAFAPDGRTLVLDQCDGLVHVIELASGKERRSFGKKYIPSPPPLTTSGYLTSVKPMWTGAVGSSTVAISPDGRLIAHAGMDSALGIWDATTGQLLARFAGHTGRIAAVAFAPDGRTVASAGNDTMALLWDVSGLGRKAGPFAKSPAPHDFETHWKALQGDDAAAGYDAIHALTASPKPAVAFLKTALHPVNSAEVTRMMQQLDSSDFNVRQEAQAKLLILGDPVIPYLDGDPVRFVSLEARRRLDALHAALTTQRLTGDRLRLVRAIEVLERIATDDARQVLETLANGAQGALATSQAQAALKRLKK